VATSSLLRPEPAVRTPVVVRRSPTRDRSAPPARTSSAVACRLRMSPLERDWLVELSRRYPELLFEVALRFPLGNREMLTELRAVLTPGVNWRAEIETLPGVVAVESLGVRGGSEHLRVVERGGPWLGILMRHRLAPEYPHPVKGGVATLTFVAGERTLRELIDELRGSAAELSLASVQSGPCWRESGILTARQREVLHRAMGLGYFDVPRKISLTALARRLGVAKSTLSALLALIEGKVLREAMVREGLDTPSGAPGPIL
jgi:hypothetical protein